MSRYPIPRGVFRAEYRQGNSRFLAAIAPAATVGEARAFIRSVRAEMPDATHHVYAMKIGHGASVTEGMSDDGEPSGTSGPPVLAALRGADIGDAVIVVTRYFGGTKLGTGGLVTAYTAAAKEVLAIVETEIKIARIAVSIECEYGHFERVRQILERHEAIIETQEFAAGAVLAARVPAERLDTLNRELQDCTAGRTAARPLDS